MHAQHSLGVLLTLTLLALSHPVLAQQRVEPNTLRLGLGGYSPVSYFEHDHPHFGTPRYRATHGGVTYLFLTADERETFLADPQRYVPAYDGWCAYGVAVEGLFDADPTNYKIIDGRLNVFLRNEQVDTLQLWNDGDENKLHSDAESYWAELHTQPSRAYLGARNLDGTGVALQGYSPVSYFTQGRAERGDARFSVEHDGVTYHLTSPAQVDVFNASPDRFVPQFGGWCAFGMSVQDKFPIDPTAFKVVDDKLYVFLRNADIDARALWEQGDDSVLIEKATSHWAQVSGG